MQYKTEPYKHQREDVEKILNEGRQYYALFYDMGAGKTKTAIDIMRGVYTKNRRFLKTLIIAPLAVLENWKREFLIHSNIEAHNIQVIDGTSKANGKKLKNPSSKLRLDQVNNDNASIFVVNPEALSSGSVWKFLSVKDFEAIVIDESHKFKSSSAARTKTLHKWLRDKNPTYRFILTGSPILQNALDLWSQFYILNPNILGHNFFTFRSKYFYDANAGMPSQVHFPNWIPKDKNYYKKLGLPYNDDFKDLNKIIYEHATRVMKDDVLDLPPYVKQTIKVGMPKDTRRIYDEFKNNLVAFLNEAPDISKVILSDDVTDIIDTDINMLGSDIMAADLAIVKTLRLNQLASGIFTKDTGEVEILKTEKVKILKDLLEEITANKENKVIIWSVFSATYDLIADVCKELGINYRFLTGKQNKEQKQESIDDFQNDKDVQVIISNQAAGGTGVNLTAANYEIYYSYTFNLEHELQSRSRANRSGQKRKVTSYTLATEDTIELNVLEALEKKTASAENILAVEKFSREDILGLI